jgi:hypothetical protein
MRDASFSYSALRLTFLLLMGGVLLVGCDVMAPFEGGDQKEFRYRVDVTVETSGGTGALTTTLSQEGDSPPAIAELTPDRAYRIEGETQYSGNPWLLIVTSTATVPVGEWFSVTIEYTDLTYDEPQTSTVFEETYSGSSSDDPTIDALESFPR